MKIINGNILIMKSTRRFNGKDVSLLIRMMKTWKTCVQIDCFKIGNMMNDVNRKQAT